MATATPLAVGRAADEGEMRARASKAAESDERAALLPYSPARPTPCWADWVKKT
jgi:hypothetical protein